MIASKKTLNVTNLEQLGVKRLAELLIEISNGDDTAKRKLRLELAANLSPKEAAKEVRKRLNAIARSKSFIEWHKVDDAGADLEAQLQAIVKTISPREPVEAFELLKKFLSLAKNVFERSDDGSGYLGDIFYQAREYLGTIATSSNLEPIDTADYVLQCIKENHYGEYDGIITILASALQKEGLSHLKKSVLNWSEEKIVQPDDDERIVIGYGSNGEYYEDDMNRNYRDSHMKYALQEIADAQGDVDGFIAQYTEDNKTVPKISAEIAQRLLDAGRLDEAWTAINNAQTSGNPWVLSEWEDVRINILEARGDIKEVKKFRWACFERSLDESQLKAYLKFFPDFENIEAEEKALQFACEFKEVHQALIFLINWNKKDYAAKLVMKRKDELYGDFYQTLPPVAQALEEKYPLAATAIYRTMIDFNLEKAKTTRYKHAARHLMECHSLSSMIEDYQSLLSHEEYMLALNKKHGRKKSFWQHVQ